MDTKPWWQSKTIWGGVITALVAGLSLFHVDISDQAPELTTGVLGTIGLVGTILVIVGRVKARTVISSDPAPLNPNQPLMRLLLCAALASGALALQGCRTLDVAQNPVGAAVISKVSNNVIDQGLNAGATRIDTGNPYLHALADGLRSVEGEVLTADDIRKIAADYGDPANKSKFKTLALDVWGVIKNAALKIGWAAATEAAAQGVQAGATNPAPTSP